MLILVLVDDNNIIGESSYNNSVIVPDNKPDVQYDPT